MKFISKKQQQLFAEIAECGDLVFACGPPGISANLVGRFVAQKNHKSEDQLNVGDGTHHVHIDWSRVQTVTRGDFHGEGMLTFYHRDKPLFRLYRIAGPYPERVNALVGSLIDEREQ